MNFVDAAPRLVFLRQRKKGALLFQRDTCKGTAEKSYFDGFQIAVLQSGKPCLYDLARFFRFYISPPCRNFALIAENAIIGQPRWDMKIGMIACFFMMYPAFI